MHNTISQTQAAETPPEIRTRARTQLSRMDKKTHKEKESKVETTTAQLENEVQQALEVMDTDTGKIIN